MDQHFSGFKLHFCSHFVKLLLDKLVYFEIEKLGEGVGFSFTIWVIFRNELLFVDANQIADKGII